MNLKDAKMYALVHNGSTCGCESIYRLVQKHDVEANWNKAVNFRPLAGELIVYDVDSEHKYPRLKVGDGKTLVMDLPFFSEDAIGDLYNKLDKETQDRIKAVQEAIQAAADDAAIKAKIAEDNAKNYADLQVEQERVRAEEAEAQLDANIKELEKEQDQKWEDFNLENGIEEGSLQQKGYYRDGTRLLGGTALGKVSIALNKGTTTYMVGDIAVGGSTIAGMTEEEFNSYYWDSVNNVPLHGGQGLINNKITDNEGRDYTQAISCAFASGDGATAKYRASFASGQLVNASAKHQAVFGAFVGNGGEYLSDNRYNDEDMQFIVGCGDNWATSGNRFALAKFTGHAYFPNRITIKNDAQDDMDVPSYAQMKDYTDAASIKYIRPTSNSESNRNNYELNWELDAVKFRRGFNVGANDSAQGNKFEQGYFGLIGGNNSVNRQTSSLVFGQFLEGAGPEDSSNRPRLGSATFGAFNVRNDDAVLTVGNGISTSNRNNAFTVLWDGRAKVSAQPKEDNDILRFQDVTAITNAEIDALFVA